MSSNTAKNPKRQVLILQSLTSSRLAFSHIWNSFSKISETIQKQARAFGRTRGLLYLPYQWKIRSAPSYITCFK